MMSTKSRVHAKLRPDSEQFLLCLELGTNEIGFVPDPEQTPVINRLLWRRSPEELAALAEKKSLRNSGLTAKKQSAAAG
jgi:hypothetical protein